MERRRTRWAVAAALAVAASTLTTSPAHAAGGYTAEFGAANPLHALGAYSLGSYVLADIDADGDLDVVVRERTTNTTIDVLRNDGGSFTVLTGAASPFAGISFPAGPFNFVNTRVLVGDFDVDGDVDLWHHGDGFAHFYRNDGGTFSAHSGGADPLHALALRDPGSYVVVDVDGDSDPDVVVREPSGDASLELFRNDGGTFTVTAAPFAAISFAAHASNFLNVNVLVLDADGDGDLDLWHREVGATAAFYRNDGATFSEHRGADDPLQELAGYEPGTYTVADVDSDGDADVAAREPTAWTTVDVLRRDGGGFTRLTGGASPFTAAPLGSIEWRRHFLLVGDLDGDGDADVYNHAENRLFRQAGSAPIVTARAPARGTLDVPVTSPLTLTFDEPVALGRGHVVLRDAATNAVVERLSVTAHAASFGGVGTNTITITPTRPLPFATTITVGVDPAAFVSSTDGDAYAGSDPVVWRFTTAANTPPQLLDIDGDTVTFTEDQGPVALDSGGAVTVVDADGIGFAGGSLSVAVTGGAVAAEDRLVAAPADHLGTVTTGAASVSIALGGGADPAAVTAWLRSLTYDNDGGDDPTPGARTVTITLDDGHGLAAHATVTVDVVAVNDPPTISAPSGLVVTAGSVVTVTGVVVGDVDSDVVQLLGELDAGTFADGRTTLAIAGSPGDVTAGVAAGSITWRAPSIARHGRLRLTVDDGDATATAEVSLRISAPASRPPASRDGPRHEFVVARPIALPAVPWDDPITAAVDRSFAAAAEAEAEPPGSSASSRGVAPGPGPGTDREPHASRVGDDTPHPRAHHRPASPHRSNAPWEALVAVFLAAVVVLLFVRRRRDDDRRRRPAR